MQVRILTGLGIVALMASGCGSGAISSRAARQEIVEIQDGAFDTDDVQIQRIVSEMNGRAVAEANIRMAFEFARDPGGEWQVVSARLGDGNWIDIDDLMTVIETQAVDSTDASMDKLIVGLSAYRARNGSLPEVPANGYVSDTLHPMFMTDLVRDDAWGGPIRYRPRGNGYELRSAGRDGRDDTPDDIVRVETAP